MISHSCCQDVLIFQFERATTVRITIVMPNVRAMKFYPEGQMAEDTETRRKQYVTKARKEGSQHMYAHYHISS